MTRIKFGDWELQTDLVHTTAAYARVAVGSPEACGCHDCRNFAANRESSYPLKIKQLFAALGIDYRKECEIGHYGRQADGLHHYSGWFHFKGSFGGKDCAVPNAYGGYSLELTPISEQFSIGFRHDSALSYFDTREGLVQVEFEVRMPWVLPDAPAPA